jgi:acetolactate synthase I/II/III large subunit
MENKMRVADWITNRLESLGVERIYALPGGLIQVMDDAISHSKLQVIWMLDERACGFAACAEAQYTGKLAVTVTTAGPGSTNLMTPIASAWCDSLPVLCICGEINTVDLFVKRKYDLREGGAQDVNMVKVARPIVKYVECAENAVGAKYIFEQCVKWALEDRRGPVMEIIPLDVQAMIIEDKHD